MKCLWAFFSFILFFSFNAWLTWNAKFSKWIFHSKSNITSLIMQKAKASSFLHFQLFFRFSLISSITALKWIFIIRHFKFFFSVNSTMLCSSSPFLSLFHLNLLAINLNVFVCNANIHIYENMGNICEQDWAID